MIGRRVIFLHTFAVVAAMKVLFPFATAHGDDTAPTEGLFNSFEIKSTNLSALPQWQRIMRAIKEERPLYTRCRESLAMCPDPGLGKWQLFLKRTAEKNLPRRQLLEHVQRFSRQWSYREDTALYGESDYWASPQEFAAAGGDCEDYAIFNYEGLKKLGVRPEKMRIVVVEDSIRERDHAVLAVYPSQEENEKNTPVYILDSLMAGVLPENKFSQYTPVYSVNHTARWIHIPQKRFTPNNDSSYK